MMFVPSNTNRAEGKELITLIKGEAVRCMKEWVAFISCLLQPAVLKCTLSCHSGLRVVDVIIMWTAALRASLSTFFQERLITLCKEISAVLDCDCAQQNILIGKIITAEGSTGPTHCNWLIIVHEVLYND